MLGHWLQFRTSIKKHPWINAAIMWLLGSMVGLSYSLSSNYIEIYSERASQSGQDMKKREFKDQSWLGLKTRSRDATLSRHKGININELYLHTKIATT